MALQITLAGEVTIQGGDGDRLPLRRARARVAFAMLTLERSRGVPRDTLAEAVWPGGVPKTWSSALRNVVSDVRAFLTQVLPEGVDPVLASTGRYQLLLPDDVLVDVELAEGAVAAAQEALAAGDHRRAYELAWQGADVLRAPFLADHDADWALRQQNRLAQVVLVGLETASAADEAIAREPLRESAHRRRMAAHVVAGNRSEALKTYQHLRRLLAEAYGADPSPETEEAYIALLGPAPLAGDAALLGWPGGTTGGVAGAAAGGGRAGGAPLPFVGRQAELAVLVRAWERTVSARACHVVLVTGDTGIGKTRLVTTTAQHVSAREGLVLLGRCDRDPTLPYQPFVEMLDGFVAEIPEDELPRLDPAARAELAAVFPSFEAPTGLALEAVGPTAMPGAVTPTDRGRLFEAVADLLVAATVDRAVAMVLDDLQWADADTLLLLRHLLRRARDVPLLVAAVARDPTELARPLADVMHTAERDGRLDRVVLDGLAEPDVRALIEHLRPEAGDDADRLARRLLSDTAGNPFMLVELLRDGRGGDGHGGATGSLAGDHVPSGVQDLVEDKLAAIDPAGRDLLRAASVAGTTFELDLVAAAAGLDEMVALDAIDAALASRVVAEVPTAGPSGTGTAGHHGGHRYRFTHEIMQRRLYEQLSGPRRRLLHARLADAIEARRATQLDQYTPVLARHRLAAAGSGGDHQAVRWARAAARHAGQRRAVAEVLRLHRQALEHVPADDPGLRAEVLADLGRAEVEAGDARGEQSLLDATVLARRSARLDVAARAALGIADLARAAGAAIGPTATPARGDELRAEALALIDDVLHDLATTSDASPELAGATATPDSTAAPAPDAAPHGPIDQAQPDVAGPTPDLGEAQVQQQRLVHARLVARYVQFRQAGTDVSPVDAPGAVDQPAPPADVTSSRSAADSTPDAGPDPGSSASTGSPIAAMARWAQPVLGDHLAALAGPAHLDERLALADDLAAVATAVDDPGHQAIALHHRAMVQATIAGGPPRAELRPDLVTRSRPRPHLGVDDSPSRTETTRASGPASDAPSATTELLLIERDIAVAVTQGRFDDAWAAAEHLAGRLGDTERSPVHEADKGVAPPPGIVAGRQMLVAWWLQGAGDDEAGRLELERERVLQELGALGEGGAKDRDPDPAEQALLALVRGDRGRGRLAARAAAHEPSSLPGDDRWLHSVGLLALVAVELQDPGIAAAAYDLLAPHAGQACGVGYRSFVGAVTFHLGRLAAVVGDHADAERHLVAALQEHSDSRARPWIALTQHALADALEARSRAYDRDWVTVLRGESRSLANALGLRPLGG